MRQRLSKRRYLAAVSFHRLFAGIVCGQREFQVAVEAGEQIAQVSTP
jgi:hypothetical protein